MAGASVDYPRGMERLLLAVQELSLAQELADVQRVVRTAAREMLGCDGATIVLRDEDTCFYADELDQVATNLDQLHATEVHTPKTGQEPDESN